MRTVRHHVLVRISEADRRQMFEKPIVRDDGEVVFLVTGIQAEQGTDASYAQSVSAGEVICVGADVEHVKVGDKVLLDYIVDLTEEIKLYQNKDEKLVRLDTRTIFRPADNIIPANRRTPHPTPAWRKGELDKASLLIAIVREGKLQALWPYLILEHKEVDSEFKMEEGSRFFTLEENEKEIVERKILSTSDSEFPEGSSVLCENDALFTRTVNGNIFDVVFIKDVFAVELKQ